MKGQRWQLIAASIPALVLFAFLAIITLPGLLDGTILTAPDPWISIATVPPFVGSLVGIFWTFKSQDLASGFVRAGITFMLPLLWFGVGAFVVLVYGVVGL